MLTVSMMKAFQKNVLQIIGVKTDQTTLTLQFPIDNLIEGNYTFDG